MRVMLVLILATSLLSSFQLLRQTLSADAPNDSDFIFEYERQLSEIRPYLQGQKDVGYIDDRPLNMQTLKEFYITQYILTPLIVQGGTKAPYIIARYTRKEPQPADLLRDRLVLVRDCGNGVFLLKRIS